MARFEPQSRELRDRIGLYGGLWSRRTTRCRQHSSLCSLRNEVPPEGPVIHLGRNHPGGRLDRAQRSRAQLMTPLGIAGGTRALPADAMSRQWQQRMAVRHSPPRPPGPLRAAAPISLHRRRSPHRCTQALTEHPTIRPRRPPNVGTAAAGGSVGTGANGPAAPTQSMQTDLRGALHQRARGQTALRRSRQRMATMTETRAMRMSKIESANEVHRSCQVAGYGVCRDVESSRVHQ